MSFGKIYPFLYCFKKNTGINDNLSGIEYLVIFSLSEEENSEELEIVQSLAKWKRI